MPLSGKRSAAPTRDTAEPAPPGRWCRPLEGVQTTRQCVWAWAHSVAVAHSEMPLSGKRSAAPTRGTAEPAPPGRWCRPLEGVQTTRQCVWAWAHSVAVAHSEMPVSGKRSAAPTRDTAEPALPGRWCRPLEGVQTTRQCVWAGVGTSCGGEHFLRTQRVLVVDAVPYGIGQVE